MILYIATFVVSCSPSGVQAQKWPVTNACASLRGYTTPVPLEGDWAFWFGTFIPPELSIPESASFARFPSSWSEYSQSFPRKGHASYAVRIEGLDPSVSYALRLPGYSSACRYFINGKQIYSCGLPSENPVEEQWGWDSQVVMLPLGLSSCVLTLHISNYSDVFPASQTAILIGPSRAIRHAYITKRISIIIPFGAILAMGAYFLALFAVHRQERSCLWLGLLSCIFALRSLCYDEFLLQDIFPGVSTSLMFRLGYLTYSLAVGGFSGFISSNFPGLANRKIVAIIVSVSLLYALMNLVTPPSVFTAALLPFQVFSLLSAVYALALVIRAARRGREGALLFLLSFAVFFLVVIRDIAIANRIIRGVFLSHYGILGIIFVMALIIVRRFSGAFTRLESASAELARVNESLERFVPNQFLQYLGKSSITDISLGDSVRRDMCVMFLHLGVDAPLSGTLDRLNMLEFFNETLQRINPVISRHGGFVDKYLAEGCMVLFPDDSNAALGCAQELARLMRQYNTERALSLLPSVKFSAGIHRGTLILGTIGERERMESTVISDVVNTASRMMEWALASEKCIVISEDIASRLDGANLSWIQPLGPVTLRGRESLTILFEVACP